MSRITMTVLPRLRNHSPDMEEEEGTREEKRMGGGRKRGERRGGRQFTDHPVVEVIRQHPLTHSHQQPEGFLLLGVQQQHRGQDVHGLHCTEGQKGDH